jgi:hypothetical protein
MAVNIGHNSIDIVITIVPVLGLDHFGGGQHVPEHGHAFHSDARLGLIIRHSIIHVQPL